MQKRKLFSSNLDTTFNCNLSVGTFKNLLNFQFRPHFGFKKAYIRAYNGENTRFLFWYAMSPIKSNHSTYSLLFELFNFLNKLIVSATNRTGNCISYIILGWVFYFSAYLGTVRQFTQHPRDNYVLSSYQDLENQVLLIIILEPLTL